MKKSKPVKTAAAAEPAKKKKAAPAKKEEPAEEDDAAEDEENDDAVNLATEIDGEDDEVTEGESLFQEGQDVGKIPEVSKKVKDNAKAKFNGEPGVIYIGRIPHGFYEHEMRQYFTQFGEITRLRLSRNKKTGASKHFAFVEFAEESTAEVVAKTMDNYLLFGHILKCKVVPKAQVHENLFKGANQRFKKVPWNRMAGKKLEKPKTEAAWESKIQREKNKRAKNAEKLKALGYEFEAPELKSAPAPGAKGEGDEKKDEEEPKAIEAAPAKETPSKKAKSPAAKKAKKAKA